MPAIVRVDKKGLAELIDNLKASGNDTTELDNLMAEVIKDANAQQPVKRREASMRVMVEEPTTEERLAVEVGVLFPGGIITGEILKKCIEIDGNYTLQELRDMCREAGLSPRGHKKELAAKLLAAGRLK